MFCDLVARLLLFMILLGRSRSDMMMRESWVLMLIKCDVYEFQTFNLVYKCGVVGANETNYIPIMMVCEPVVEENR